MAQTTYATMFILAVLTSFWNLTERKKEHLAPLDLSASPQVKINFEIQDRDANRNAYRDPL